jgi:hypothetical protein
VERIFLIGAAGPLPSLLDAAAGAGIVRLPLATVAALAGRARRSAEVAVVERGDYAALPA